MDDIIVRSRYPRYNAPNRRRKRNPRGENTLAEKVLAQLIVSIIIFVIVVIIKIINTPATNFLTDKIRYTVAKNVELISLYEGIENLLGKTKKDKKDEKVQEVFDETVLPVSSNLDKPGSSSVKGFYIENYSAVDEKSDTAYNYMDTYDEFEKNQGFIIPVNGVLSSPFGERFDPKTESLKLHKGIDIEADNGSTIRAALEGTIMEAGSERTYGNYIKIEHNNGLITVYAHCSQLTASKGQRVRQGDAIAKVGDTGASVGSHLHFEIWKDGKALDPLNYVDIPLE
jgi:murein DD-endopeptidase MepM/ murein hydrolase activator NlpD